MSNDYKTKEKELSIKIATSLICKAKEKYIHVKKIANALGLNQEDLFLWEKGLFIPSEEILISAITIIEQLDYSYTKEFPIIVTSYALKENKTSNLFLNIDMTPVGKDIDSPIYLFEIEPRAELLNIEISTFEIEQSSCLSKKITDGDKGKKIFFDRDEIINKEKIQFYLFC